MNERTELLIYGLIGQDAFGRGVSANWVVEQLAKAKGTKELVVRIHSPGGSVFEGVAIHNAIARHPARKTVYVDGLAASMASYIMLVGDRIVMAANARAMIHAPRLDTEGATIDELESGVERLRAVRKIMSAGYAARTKQPPERIAEWMAAEKWFTASEALEAGLVDEIEQPMRMAALADSEFALLEKYRNTPPEALSAWVRCRERPFNPNRREDVTMTTRTTNHEEAWAPPGFRERYARDIAELRAHYTDPMVAERAIRAYSGVFPAAWVEAVAPSQRRTGAPAALPSTSRKEDRMMIEASMRAAIAREYAMAPQRVEEVAAKMGTEPRDLDPDEREACKLWGVSAGIYAECKATVQLTREELGVALRHGPAPEAMLRVKAMNAARKIDGAIRTTARRGKGA